MPDPLKFTPMRKTRTPAGILLLALLGLMLSPRAFGDSQIWASAQIRGSINNDWNLGMTEEIRFDDAHEIVSYHTDVGLTLGLAPWLALGLHYRHIFWKRSEGWTQERRPHVNGSIQWTSTGIHLKDRSRLEYRIREWTSNMPFYRNELTVSPSRCEILGARAFLSDEIFFELHPLKFSRNRLSVAIEREVLQCLTLRAFYILQSDHKDDAWEGTRILGLTARTSLP
jgi:hypothetical protein